MQYEMEELLPIVADLTEKFTSGESSSITYERANQLMEAVLYCINELEEGKKGLWPDKDDKMPASEAYRMGYQLVMDKVLRVKEQYNAGIDNFLAYGNHAYYETVVKGMPGFFLYYDPLFCPQDHILTLDYPVLCPYSVQSGIDVVEKYMDGIWIEQHFLGKLPPEYVTRVLEEYHPDYQELLINVSAIIMRNILGCMMVDKPLMREGFTKEEYDEIKEKVRKMKPEEVKEELSGLLAIFLGEGYKEAKNAMFEYFEWDVRDFAYELMNAAEHDCLDVLLLK